MPSANAVAVGAADGVADARPWPSAVVRRRSATASTPRARSHTRNATNAKTARAAPSALRAEPDLEAAPMGARPYPDIGPQTSRELADDRETEAAADRTLALVLAPQVEAVEGVREVGAARGPAPGPSRSPRRRATSISTLEPGGDTRSAFSTRFASIWCTRSGSVRDRRGAVAATRSMSGRSRARTGAAPRATSDATVARSTSTGRTENSPASRRARSSRSCTSRSRRCDSRTITAPASPGLRVVPSESASPYPRIAVSGVRSSCDTYSRNVFSRWFADSRSDIIAVERALQLSDLGGIGHRDRAGSRLPFANARADAASSRSGRRQAPRERVRHDDGDRERDEASEHADGSRSPRAATGTSLAARVT